VANYCSGRGELVAVTGVALVGTRTSWSYLLFLGTGSEICFSIGSFISSFLSSGSGYIVGVISASSSCSCSSCKGGCAVS